MKRGYDRIEVSISRSYDEIKGVTMSVSRDFHMLCKITTGKKVEELDCLSISEVVDMDVEVAGYNKIHEGWWLRGKETMRIG